jgi:hypothetical protein
MNEPINSVAEPPITSETIPAVRAEGLEAQGPLVHLSQSTPSADPRAADGRCRRIEVSADRDGSRLAGSGIDCQEEIAERRLIAT